MLLYNNIIVQLFITLVEWFLLIMFFSCQARASAQRGVGGDKPPFSPRKHCPFVAPRGDGCRNRGLSPLHSRSQPEGYHTMNITSTAFIHSFTYQFIYLLIYLIICLNISHFIYLFIPSSAMNARLRVEGLLLGLAAGDRHRAFLEASVPQLSDAKCSPTMSPLLYPQGFFSWRRSRQIKIWSFSKLYFWTPLLYLPRFSGQKGGV